MGIIDLDGLEVRLGNRTVLNGLTGELQGQRHRIAWSQWRGQVHADQYAAWVSSTLQGKRPRAGARCASGQSADPWLCRLYARE
jgi:hypothetical protein